MNNTIARVCRLSFLTLAITAITVPPFPRAFAQRPTNGEEHALRTDDSLSLEPAQVGLIRRPQTRRHRVAVRSRWLSDEMAETIRTLRRKTPKRPNAVTGPSTWTGGTGNWSDGAKWNPITSPNSAGADVSIDSGNAATSAVTIDGNFTVGRVTIDAGDTLTLQNSRLFTVADSGGFSGAGTIANSGVFSIASVGSFTDLLISGSVSLTGGGTVTLAQAARIRSGGGTAILTNVNNTINASTNGFGTLGNNDIGIVNQSAGIIDANVNGTGLSVDPGSVSGLVNQGTMRASNGGILTLTGNGGGAFNNTGGTIQALTGSEVQLTAGAQISGGTLTTTGTGVVRNVGGATLTDVTNAGTLIGNNGTAGGNGLFLVGTMTNNGSISLASTGGFTDLFVNGTVNLVGSGTLTLANAARIRGTGTLNNSSTIQGESSNFGSLGNNELTIVNQSGGLIDANNATGLALGVDPSVGGNLTNQGLMRASNGGRLHLTGNAGGAFINTGGTISALDLSEVRLFAGAAISGGTLSTAGNGTIRVVAGNTASLADLTNSGNFVGENGSTTTLVGAINNTGSITVNSTGGFTDLFAGGVTLTGGGTINLSNADRVRGTGTLTNVDNIIQGETFNSGSLGNNELTIVNQSGGLIDANNATGLALGVDPSVGGNLTNQGLMRASNGGRLHLTGNAGGVFNNTGGTISALDLSEVRLFAGAAISGGTLSTAGNGTIRVVAGNTASLTDLTNSGNFVGENGSTTTLVGAINNTGSITVNSTGGFTDLFAGGVTLTGGGTINLSNADRVRGTGTFTNVDNIIQGETSNSGSLGNNELGIVNSSGGLIDANIAGLALGVDPSVGGNLTNQGLMRASNGGRLHLTGNAGGVFNNTGGTISALDLSEVRLFADAAISGGTLSTAGNGTIRVVVGNTASLADLANTGSFVSENASTTTLFGTINNSGSININSLGSFTDLFINGAVTLSGAGTVTLSSADRVRGAGTAPRLTNAGNTIQGENQNFGSLGNNDLAITNQSIINANVLNLNLGIDPANVVDAFVNDVTGIVRASSGGRIVLTGNAGGSFTNNGIFEVLNASLFTMDASAVLTNNIAGVLTLGSYRAIATGGGAVLTIRGANITRLAANTEVILSGAGSVFQVGTTALETTLTTNDGTLRILDNRNYTNVNALTDGGMIELGGGIFNSPSLTIGATGEFFGFGTVTPRPTNSGLIRAVGGTLAFTNGIQGGSGTVQIDPTGILNLSTSATASSADFLTHNGTTNPSLLLGSQNFVVGLDYTNANFGVGNSFNPRANVSGTGAINAAGNVGQSLSGNVSNGTTATPLLVFGNVHVGDAPTQNYQINNTGTTGPSLRGALQTSVNGGNITDGRLTGTGVTASNFGPIALNSGSGNFAVTFNATSAGALVNQVLHLINNFDNVGDQNLSISGVAFRYANPTAHTPEPINFGNFHVGDAAPSQILSIMNNVPNDMFSEALDGSIGSPTGGVTTNLGSFNLLAPGATNNTSLIVGMDTSVAGNRGGTATITLQSNGSGSSGLGTTNLPSQTVNVSGSVFRYASPTVHTPEPVAFGIVHVGDSPSLALGLTNNVPADGFSESLNASIGGASAGITTNGGSFTGLAPGATNNTNLSIGINTATAGLRSGTATISLQSNGAGSSGLGLTNLAGQTVNVTGQVNFYADPVYTLQAGAGTVIMNSATLFTLNFGSIVQNSGTLTASLALLNFLHNATFQDSLGGTFNISTVNDFMVTGFNPFAGIAPGAAFNPMVAFNSAMALGTYTDTIFLTPVSTNASGSTNLAPIQLNIQATIVPEPSVWVLVVAGAGLLVGLQRARRMV